MTATAEKISLANEVSQNEVCMMKVEGKYYAQQKQNLRNTSKRVFLGPQILQVWIPCTLLPTSSE